MVACLTSIVWLNKSSYMLKLDRKLYDDYYFSWFVNNRKVLSHLLRDRFFWGSLYFRNFKVTCPDILTSVFFSVDGGFGLWSEWTTCSQTCGTGTQSRSRTCTNPVPANQGQNCSGEYDQAKSCKLTSCPGNSRFRAVDRYLGTDLVHKLVMTDVRASAVERASLLQLTPLPWNLA